jgi:transcriptional regulator with XRE-family HTH domain
MAFPTPLTITRTLLKLGTDLSRARRRRRFTRASVAERAGVSEATVKRLEKGDGRVALESVARVLNVLNELNRLDGLIDAVDDDLGIQLMDEQLPKRVRRRRTTGAL